MAEQRTGRSGATGLMDAPTATESASVDTGTTEGATGTENDTGTDTATATRVRRNPDELPDDEMVSINLRLPNALRKLIAADAMQQVPATSVPQLIAGMVAEPYGYALPTPTRSPRVKKYANKEERVAAQKAAQQKQRNITRGLLKLIEQGKLDVDLDALVAEVEAEQHNNGTS